MIPKRALYYWSGPPMSWLRRQSIESFIYHNPDWEIRNIAPPGIIDDRTPRDIVIDSDWARYAALAEEGGFYFDTDIIWTAPVPEEWLSKDNCIVSRDGMAQGIAVLGSKPRSKFFQSFVIDCEKRRASKVILAYQSLGIKLFVDKDVRHLAATLGETIYQIHIERLFPCPWSGVEKLWSPIEWRIPQDNVGVHWFGGDEISKEFEPKIMAETLNDFPCLVTSVLKQGVAA